MIFFRWCRARFSLPCWGGLPGARDLAIGEPSPFGKLPLNWFTHCDELASMYAQQRMREEL